MLGWKLFAHAVRMITGNWRAVLRIFLVPSLIGGALALAFVSVAAVTVESTTQATGPAASAIVFILAAFIAYAVIFTWCVVAWHRFVLLQEIPTGWIPIFRKDRIFSYWGAFLRLVFVSLLIMIPALFILATAPVAIMVVFGTVGSIVATAAAMRVMPILPAAAVGKPLKIAEAWNATAGAFITLVALAIAFVLFQAAIQAPGWLLAYLNLDILSFVWSIVSSVAISLINVSLLTTLYGHFVEGRSID